MEVPRSNPLLEAWTELVPSMRGIVESLGFTWTEWQSSFDSRLEARWRERLRGLPAGDPLRVALRRTKLARRRLRRRYAYAIPTPEALEALLGLGRPVIEIGAGKGYWAALLRERGLDVVASDRLPAASNPWVTGSAPFLEDLVTGASLADLLGGRSGHVLMLQWVVGGERGSYALEALRHFEGRDLVVVGSEDPTVCGGRAFQEGTRAWGRLQTRLPLPRFPGILDGLYHYRRSTRPRDGDRAPGDSPGSEGSG